MSRAKARRCAMILSGALMLGAASTPTRSAKETAGIQWVKIPGGTFMMGTDDTDKSFADAHPPHLVAIKSFEMSKTLVTNKQYRACVAAGACKAAHTSDGSCFIFDGKNMLKGKKGNLTHSFRGDEQPVVCVAWDQAKAFARWAGGRLPTEAEWEYAARSGGKDQKYPWGNEDPACAKAMISGCGYTATAPVCSKTAGNTQQGLCDMAGNAWEWVEDWYHGSYNGAPTDGSAWEDTGSYRVVLGGSWYGGEGRARSAHRGGSDPGDITNDLGFRLAR